MTDQEIFDKVYAHFRANGFKVSWDGASKCMYRAPDGNRCAVGVLITDENYYLDLEGSGAMEKCVVEALLGSGIERRQLSFVRRLQLAHDNLAFKVGDTLGLKEALIEVAICYNLRLPSP